jgi:hypothetical protein
VCIKNTEVFSGQSEINASSYLIVIFQVGQVKMSQNFTTALLNTVTFQRNLHLFQQPSSAFK